MRQVLNLSCDSFVSNQFIFISNSLNHDDDNLDQVINDQLHNYDAHSSVNKKHHTISNSSTEDKIKKHAYIKTWLKNPLYQKIEIIIRWLGFIFLISYIIIYCILNIKIKDDNSYTTEYFDYTEFPLSNRLKALFKNDEKSDLSSSKIVMYLLICYMFLGLGENIFLTSENIVRVFIFVANMGIVITIFVFGLEIFFVLVMHKKNNSAHLENGKFTNLLVNDTRKKNVKFEENKQ